MAAVDSRGRRSRQREYRAPQQEARHHRSQISIQIQYLSGCSAVGSAPALGAGCRGFESRHSDQNAINRFCGLWHFLFVLEVGFEKLNATRTSVAAASSMAAILYLRLWAQMQTNPATRTKNRLIWSKISRFFTIISLVEEIIFLNHINLIKGSENYFITALFFVYCIPIFIRTSQTIQFDMLAYMLFCRFHHEKLLDTHLPYIRTDRKSMHSYQRRIHLLP